MEDKTLLVAWNRLGEVKQLTCRTQSKECHQNGKASVSVTKKESILIFQEKGNWHGKMHFTNTFRWTLDHDAGAISLEHLRYGSNSPVFLVSLIPLKNHFFTSLYSHICGRDAYTAKMHLDHHLIHLHWQILGPKKNTEIHSVYF